MTSGLTPAASRLGRPPASGRRANVLRGTILTDKEVTGAARSATRGLMNAGGYREKVVERRMPKNGWIELAGALAANLT
jgi:hypothetical protein